MPFELTPAERTMSREILAAVGERLQDPAVADALIDAGGLTTRGDVEEAVERAVLGPIRAAQLRAARGRESFRRGIESKDWWINMLEYVGRLAIKSIGQAAMARAERLLDD